MNTIDQRILLPTSPTIVWEYISHLAQNPDWQVDCQYVHFLTTSQKGQGTRWRITLEGGREYVAEITAWYDRIGYEYRFVEGVPYKENNGRLRLQEVPEGTILQWTFNYETAGMLGGLRNSLGLKRSIEQTMADSLWTLFRHMSQVSSKAFEAKSLMQEAPDVERRAQYKPRHPSVMEDYQQGDALSRPQSAGIPFVPAPVPVIPEPPISDDDTRPRPVIADPESELPPMSEPDFLRDHREVDFDRPTDPKLVVSQISPVPITDASLELASDISTQQPEIDELGLLSPKFDVPEPVRESPSAAPFAPSGTNDVSQKSVFEIFGVPKPSETEEIRTASIIAAVQASERTEPEITTRRAPAPVVMLSGRRGRRIYTRSRLVRLRRPG